MSHGATVPVVAVSEDAAAEFLMRFSDIVKQEARKIGRRCFHLQVEDLHSEGMLHIIERLAYFMEAENPQPYVRVAVRRYLARYAFVHDSLIRTPASGHVERQVEQRFCTSLDMSLGGYEVGLADLLSAPSDDEGYGSLEVALSELSDLHRQVLELRFGGRSRRLMSFGNVGKALGVSRSTAFRLVQEALAILRRELVGEVAA